MRRQRRRTGGVSLGTLVILILTGLVVGGCVLLFPKLVGNIELRVDPQTVGVALDSALRGVPSGTDGSGNAEPDATPATAPPLTMNTLAPTATSVPAQTLTLTATGSIKVDTLIQRACTSENGYDFTSVFEPLRDGMKSAINLATLENLTVANEKLTDVNMPVDALNAIRDCGINVLCNGFYGAFNNGVAGLAATQDAIVQTGMTPYGVYASAEARQHVTTLQVGDLMVALLSFQNELSAAGNKRTSKEEEDFAYALLTLPTITKEIMAARAAGAKVVIVSLCWGKEGATLPSKTQKQLAQSIADAGADLILGTHSGTLQSVEILTANRADGSVHQTLCAYSLGNLLESDRAEREAISGALLHVEMSYNLAQDELSFGTLTYTPTYVWRGRVNGIMSYRVLRSNAEPPAYVDAEQRKVMERCLKLVRDALKGSPLTEAQ